MGAIVVAAALAALLVGCSTAPPTVKENTMTPAESMTQLHTEFDEIQSLVGSSWEAEDGLTPHSCRLPDGTEGVAYNAFRLSDATDSREKAFELVKARWKKAGYSLSERHETDAAPMLRLFATTPDGRELQFTAADLSMSLEGSSICVPGNADDMILNG